MSRRRTTAPLAASDSTSFLSDPELAHLSATQKDRLNEAFDRAGESKAERILRRDRKRRKINPEPEPQAAPEPVQEDEGGGGFIVDDAMDTGGGFVLDEDDGGGGGFLIDDNEAAGGGFLPEDPPPAQPEVDIDMSPPSPPSAAPTRTHLPLSLIPSALTLVGLPSSDAEVLDFFKQSAEGWDDAAPVDGVVGGIKEKGVSRRDWFAVCAILLSGREEEPEDEGEDQDMASEEDVQQGQEDDDDDVEEDRFSPGEEDEDEEDGGFVRERPSKSRMVLDEDDEDFDLHNTSRRRTRRAAREEPNDSPVPSLPSSPSASDASSSRPRTKKKTPAKPKKKKKAADEWEVNEVVLSKGERKYAKQTFQLLLGPDGVRRGKEVLEIKEVGYAVRILKEGWTTEEIKEMVTMFSSAPDKGSLSLKDFERLMWEGGLFP